MKHTEGPWEVGDLVENDYTPRYVEVLAGGVKIIAKATYGKTDEEAATNAHLIAAAPDLLEALKAAELLLGLQNQEGTRFAEETINKISEAINKAERV